MRDFHIDTCDLVAALCVSVANRDDLVRFLEVAHPRVSYGEEVRDHRRGKWIGLFLQIVERGLHLGGALAKVS